MKNNRGSILITTIIILTFLSVLGMHLIVYLLSRTTKVTLELDRTKAYYLAEGAIAKSVYELKSNEDPDNNGLGNILLTDLGGGTYKAIHDFQTSIITGTGQYNDVKREIQLQYSSL